MALYRHGVGSFIKDEEVEVVVPEANRKYGPPELKFEGKVGIVISGRKPDRTIDVRFDEKDENIPAAWLWRVRK